MCYRGGRGVVPTDESTSIHNCGDVYDGIRLGRMIAKFRGVATRHGHADASVAYWCGRTTMRTTSDKCFQHQQSADPSWPDDCEILRMAMSRGQPQKSMTCQGSFASHDIVCRQVVQYGGAHSAALRSALLPFPASSLPRELVSGRHLPLSEAVGWQRPPYRTTCQTTCRLRPSSLKNGVRKRHYFHHFRKFKQTG